MEGLNDTSATNAQSNCDGCMYPTETETRKDKNEDKTGSGKP